MKKTKIVATIGPASEDEITLIKLISSGVDVVRLNFSHGSFDEKTRVINSVRRVATKLKKQVSILADLPGPKLRLGEIQGVMKIKKGQVVKMGTGESVDLPIPLDFTQSLQVGQKVFVNDGLLEFVVMKVKSGEAELRAANSGWVSSRKGINLPDTKLQTDTFTAEDREAALFSIKQGVEFIAMSFVQSRQDVEELRGIIKSQKSPVRIISKIEKPEAVRNIEEIIDASDGVMVARGDLAIETSPSQVPLIQHKIVVLARQKQKPVIVATQMLESMIENPRPTRAEASDVANAVLSQVDAVMLSAESATGKYPVEAVSTMNSIIETVEADPEFKRYIRINWEKLNLGDINFNAIVSSSASLAYRLSAPIISVGTVTGKTAQQLSSFRPSALIVAMTHDEKIARQLSLYWGVRPIIISSNAQPELFDEEMLDIVRKSKVVKKGRIAILVWGSKIGVSGTTDTIRAVKI